MFPFLKLHLVGGNFQPDPHPPIGPLYGFWHKSARGPKPLGHWRLRESTNFSRGLRNINVMFFAEC